VLELLVTEVGRIFPHLDKQRMNMMKFLIHLSLFLAYTSLVCSASLPFLSYQIHSYDDLREWPAILTKGSSWIKIDLHYMDKTFCQTKSSATSRVNTQTSELGCILLNHDNPSLQRAVGYNTSDDVLAFIGDANNAKFFSNPDRRIYIALCGKFDGPGATCGNSAHAVGYLQLMELFYQQAIKLIKAQQFNVEFILDGALAYSSDDSACLIKRYLPWNMTYIYPSPKDAFLSNNSSLGYNRLAINNPDDITFYFVEIMKYGKFLNENTYPFLVWEDSDQPSLAALVKSYLGGAQHLAGLRFAINIDPVQLQLYLNNNQDADHTANRDAWNIYLGLMPQMIRPRLALLPLAYNGDLNNYVFISYFEPNQQLNYCSFYVFKTILDSSFYNLRGDVLLTSFPAGFHPNVPISTAQFSGNFLFLSNTLGEMLFFPASRIEQVLNIELLLPKLGIALSLYPNSGFAQDSNTRITVLSLGNNGNSSIEAKFLVANTYTDPMSGNLLHQVHYVEILNSTSKTFSYYTKSRAIPLLGQNHKFLHNISDATLSIAELENNLCGAPTIYAIIISFSQDSMAKILYSCYDAAKNELKQGIVAAPLAMGVQPSLSIASPGNYLHSHQRIMLTLANSYCYNSEIANKRDFPALCDSPPNSQQGVLTYFYADLEEFFSEIKQNSNNFGITACNSKILTGMYDMGQNSSVLLFPGTINPQNYNYLGNSVVEQIGVIEIHEGIRSAPTFPAGNHRGKEQHKDRRSAAQAAKASGVESVRAPLPADVCGAPIPHAGFVVDSWPLPTPYSSKASRVIYSQHSKPMSIQQA
jgi:hypothetical protein